MILTDADKDIYFPTSKLTGDALTGALLGAQAIAESNIGANRPLEVTEYKEIIDIAEPYMVGRLLYKPFVIPPTLSIEGRQGVSQDNLGRVHTPPSSWVALLPEQFIFDVESGQIFLRYAYYNQIRATYSAGFDFQGTQTQEIKAIKFAVAAILNFRSTQAGNNITSVKVDYNTVNYGSSRIEEVLAQEFILLSQYRPLGAMFG